MRFLPYIIKNVLRHKLRSAFTVLSIGFSLFLVTLLYAYIGFQDELAARSAQYHRLVLTHRNGLTDLLPAAHLDDVRAIKGVQAAAPMSWFGGIYKDDRMSMFAQFATDPGTVFRVFAEYHVPPEQLAAWQSDRTGCVVGRKIAANRGWKIGDKIPLKGDIYDCNLDLTVDGIYDGPSTADLEMLWFHYEYLDELLKSKRSPIAGQVGTIMLKAESAGAVNQLPQRIEQRFLNSGEPVRAMTEEAFSQMFTEMIGNVQAFIRNTALAVVVSLVCVAGNAMAMSLRERTREVAVLKAIGFQRWLVLVLVLGEALAISLTGGVLGVLGGKLLFEVIEPGMLGVPMLNMFYVPWNTVWLGLSLAAVVGLTSGAVPAWRAARMSVVDGLRRVV